MTRFLELAISVLIVIALFVLVGIFLPSHAHVERTTELANPIVQVYDVVNGFKRYNAWQPWMAVDPRAQYAREGADFGTGARLKWTSWEKRVGNGSLEIKETVPSKLVKMELNNEWKGENKTFTFNMESNTQTNATILTWAVDVDYGWNLFGRYAGLYLNGDVGELMSTGLSRLSNMLATFPNVDYSQVEIQVLDVQPVDLLYVGDGVPAAPRKFDNEAEPLMDKAWGEVEALMKKNKIEPAGPRRRIINVLGEESNDFKFAVPTPRTDINLTGRVKSAPGYAGKALMTVFHGHRVGLMKPRDMLKAYALSHGYRFKSELEGAYEEWLAQPDDVGAPVTNVYLPFEP